MEFTASIIIIVLFGIIIGLLIASAFLLWAAKIIGIQNRTLGKALGTVILGGIVGLILSLILGAIPIIGFVLGFFGTFIGQALIMMPLFQTDFGKALGASFISWILSIILFGGIFLTAMAVGFSLF